MCFCFWSSIFIFCVHLNMLYIIHCLNKRIRCIIQTFTVKRKKLQKSNKVETVHLIAIIIYIRDYVFAIVITLILNRHNMKWHQLSVKGTFADLNTQNILSNALSFVEKIKCNKVHYSAILYTRKHETIISIKLKIKKLLFTQQNNTQI